jgi:hypothetical protein
MKAVAEEGFEQASEKKLCTTKLQKENSCNSTQKFGAISKIEG